MTNDFSIPLLLLYAFIGWAWCGAIMAVGPAILPMQTTLILHALLGPAGFGILTFVYARSRSKPGPLALAVFFTLFVIILDAGLVAPVFVKSFEMFSNLLGTWIPFALIFMVSFFVGSVVRRKMEV